MIRIFIKVLSALLLVGLLGALGTGWAVSRYFRAVALEHFVVDDTMVEIPFGSSLRRVSAILADAKVIDDPSRFYWYLRLGRSDSAKIQAGYYNFAGGLSRLLIADRLLFGVDQSFKITFKEGETLVSLADNLANRGLVTKEQFVQAMTNEGLIKLIGAPNAAMRTGLENDVGGIEGYLFPDTYFFTKKDTAESIIKKMHFRLLAMLDDQIHRRMTERHQTLHEVLTMAAIVEKETGAPAERPMIASVYQNRLKMGMRLQADPTVIYGTKNYDGKLHKADLLAVHPYNTYRMAGLPPGPIAAPGLSSIRAALWPDETNYLYFVSRNDGTHVFCEDLACHNDAVRKWQIDYFRNAAK